MISADSAFANVANAAAAAFARAPAVVTYRIVMHVDSTPPIDAERHLVFRPGDEPADLERDGAAANAENAEQRPLPPVIDALAQWAFRLDKTERSVRMTVAYERPKRYVRPTPGPASTSSSRA